MVIILFHTYIEENLVNLINGLGGASGFGENFIARNDDLYQSGVSLTNIFGPGGLNFFGTNYTTIAINNNGNITFGGTGQSSFTPWGMQTPGKPPMIAAYFADVDTRGYTTSVNGPDAVTRTSGGRSTGSNLTWYDFNPAGNGGRGILTVTWDDVGYYSMKTDKLNAFQMRLIGTGGGNFNIEFRYEAINWTTGSASGGTNGFGGTVARAGYTKGDGANFLELSQSGIQDQMLSLESTPGNTGLAGYYRFSSRSGSASNDTIYGTIYNDILDGGAGNDTIYGKAGNDQLDGGTGNDILYGGRGNDTFVIDSSFDRIIEYSGQGNDTISTGAFSLSIAALPNVENITLTGTSSINATGNARNNILVGNSGNNVLRGGLGSDTASYQNAGTGVIVSLAVSGAQATGAGSDTLISIESLRGSIFNDTLAGNSGNNVLNGLAGADTMRGRAGNDTYYVDNTADVVVESSNQGSDTVRSTVSRTLGLNQENLALFDTTNLNGTGNALANVITGNSGINILSGGSGRDTLRGGAGADTLRGNSGNDRLFGGVGNDRLVGGLGSDNFYFDTTLNRRTNRDSITDFNHTADTIRLDRTIFTRLTSTGVLSSANFRASSNGLGDSNDYILYNTTSGALLYDRDGSGTGAAVQFASLTNRPQNVNASDFLVVA